MSTTSETSGHPATGATAAAEGPLADVRSLEVARRIESYAPRGIASTLWEKTLRPFVLPALRASRPVGVAAMERPRAHPDRRLVREAGDPARHRGRPRSRHRRTLLLHRSEEDPVARLVSRDPSSPRSRTDHQGAMGAPPGADAGPQGRVALLGSRDAGAPHRRRQAVHARPTSRGD